jgi:hypothetical protein
LGLIIPVFDRVIIGDAGLYCVWTLGGLTWMS